MISGRVITRFILLYGSSLSEMQLMQVTYAMGTAAEDIFTAYVYHVIPDAESYQSATSYIRAAGLASNLVSGVLGRRMN